MSDKKSQKPEGLVLVLNCGSSSIKFGLFDATQHPLPRQPIWSGRVVDIGGPNVTYGDSNTPTAPLVTPDHGLTPYVAALEYILERVRAQLGDKPLAGVAHRVVHGGAEYDHPVLIDDKVLTDLRNLIPLAPLHQPYALDGIAALMKLAPDLKQVACFDTAFHQTMPKVEKQLPIPHEYWDRGVRRYGFHGLSYEFMSQALPEQYGDEARGKVIAAHLGSGASLCAMKNLECFTTTMGFSALDGVMMGTRTGSIDPGVLLYMLEIEKLEVKDVVRTLYHKSGLVGVSGLSPEPRVLMAREDEDSEVGERIRDAMKMYVSRIVRQIGMLAAALNGLDMLVFTAGVGENSVEIRRRIMAGLTYLGVEIDEDANAKNGPVISSANSKVKVVVQPTNEEWIIARHAVRTLGLVE